MCPAVSCTKVAPSSRDVGGLLRASEHDRSNFVLYLCLYLSLHRVSCVVGKSGKLYWRAIAFWPKALSCWLSTAAAALKLAQLTLCVVREVLDNDNDIVQRSRLTSTDVGGRMRMDLIFGVDVLPCMTAFFAWVGC